MHGVAALMADEVDFDEPPHRIVPFRPCADRDRVLQQRLRLVCGLPRTSSFARSAASRRSIVAGDIASNAISVSSLITSWSKRRSVGTNSNMIGASRLPVGAPNTGQQNASAAMTSGP